MKRRKVLKQAAKSGDCLSPNATRVFDALGEMYGFKVEFDGYTTFEKRGITMKNIVGCVKWNGMRVSPPNRFAKMRDCNDGEFPAESASEDGYTIREVGDKLVDLFGSGGTVGILLTKLDKSGSITTEIRKTWVLPKFRTANELKMKVRLLGL